MLKTTELPAPAHEIVAAFVLGISKVKPAFVDGLYLTGSISLHDFHPNKSDIDFIVLCKSLPDKAIFSQLKHIHWSIRKRFPKPGLSGSYLASDTMLTNPPTEIKTLNYHEGKLRYAPFDMAPVSLSELKSNAITVLGQDAETLPIEVDHDQLNRFLYANVKSYWAKWIERHSSYYKRKLLLLLFPRLTEWSVLGVARQLCTIQTGKIVSKTEAGNYCLKHLPDSYHSIIREAIKIRKDKRTYPLLQSYAIKPSIQRQSHTIACLNYMVSIINTP